MRVLWRASSRSLIPLGVVREIAIDEAKDSANVRVVLSPEVSLEDVNGALEQASAGSGHDYCVRSGSWRTPADGGGDTTPRL